MKFYEMVQQAAKLSLGLIVDTSLNYDTQLKQIIAWVEEKDDLVEWLPGIYGDVAKALVDNKIVDNLEAAAARIVMETAYQGKVKELKS